MAQRFRFPLEDRDHYAAKVSFQAVQIIPPTVRSIGGSVDTSNIDASDEQSVATLARGILDDDATVTIGEPIRRNLDRASLFLPQGITFQDGVVFDEFALGRVGAVAEAAINNGRSIAGATGAGLHQNIAAITDMFNASATSDVARLAATSLSKFGGPRAQAGVQSALRVTTNPNKRLLFKEVNIREFSFNFKLVPTSVQEAEEITKIIKFFRTELYPDDSIRIDTANGSIPIGYRFPNQFNIIFKHRDREIAHKILPSYLVSMQTTYNPTGMGFFEDGNFTETEITLNFREAEALSKQRVVAEGY